MLNTVVVFFERKPWGNNPPAATLYIKKRGKKTNLQNLQLTYRGEKRWQA
jgi:hypothetical protein